MKTYDTKIVGCRLRIIRDSHRLNQCQLSQKIHCKHSSISRWENGRRIPSVQTLLAMAEVYKLKPSEFFGYLFNESEVT